MLGDNNIDFFKFLYEIKFKLTLAQYMYKE